jgi:hypothetical protein
MVDFSHNKKESFAGLLEDMAKQHGQNTNLKLVDEVSPTIVGSYSNQLLHSTAATIPVTNSVVHE